MDKNLQEQLSKMRRESEERDAQRRAKAQGFPYLELNKISVNLDVIALVPKDKAEEAQFAVIEGDDSKLVVVAYDPNFSKTKEAIKEIKDKGYKIKIYIISQSSLNYVLSFYRFTHLERSAIVGSVSVSKNEDDSGDEISLEGISSVKEEIAKHNRSGQISTLLQTILMGAIQNRASDIHIETSKEYAKVRYRIDGELNDVYNKLSENAYRAIISRIKMLSKLKLNVQNEAQDGRFTINLKNKEVEVRVAIAPSEFGEVIVMRLLDPDVINLNLEDIGFRKDDLEIIKSELSRPNGMILNTGPTGSGKTTTLYAFLRHKNTPNIKIITIEDPIEYHVKGIEQTQTNEEAGYTFASGLRSLMRQDPDIILVGEIRDKETAEIAVQASLTGHLVFSTVHANEAAAGIPRLLDLGVKAISLAPSLNMIIAQRLVRVLCEKCKKPVDIDNELKNKIENYINNIPDRVDKKSFVDNLKIFEPVGCDVCGGSGYRGRIAIFELLKITTEMQGLITKEAGEIEIKKEISKTDFVNMQQDGVLKVISGLTTFDEVERVGGKIVWTNKKI